MDIALLSALGFALLASGSMLTLFLLRARRRRFIDRRLGLK